jgi:predicted phage terminase large subunit-like protein
VLVSDAEFDAMERELCRRSLADFARRAWPILEPVTPLRWGWALDAICMHLEAVTRGEIKRLLINVPPGSMKSLLVGVMWPAWEWGPAGLPHHRFVGTAHEETLAIRDSRRCRDLIKSEWFQHMWPLQLAADLDGKREFGNTAKGVRQARAFTSMTGVRGDRVTLDDPISADAANSEAKLEAAKVAFLETLPTRVNSDQSAIVVVMQRLHERDVSGIILEKGLPYVHLRIPMRFEAENRCTTSIGWADPRTEEGELMFPERFDENQVAELEATLGEYGTAGQLQQRPAPRGGGICKPAQLQIVDAAPVVQQWVRGWDLAASRTSPKNQRPDYTAGPKLGRLPDGRFVIGDMVRIREEVDERDRAIANTAKRDGPHVTISLPQDPGQAGKGQAKYLTRELAGYPVFASPESGDKLTRALPLIAQINAGNVLMVKGPWNQALIDELATFPVGAHDDQVDGLSRAFHQLLGGQAIAAQSHNAKGL